MEFIGKYTYKYPHPAITTDCVIFGFDGSKLNVLLVERGLEPYKGSWALPGGFMRIDETAEDCAMRELEEETGLRASYIEQIGAFSQVDRDPRERVVTIAFYALVRLSDVSGGDDAADARWWAIDDIPRLAFDHQDILDTAVKVLREKVRVEPISFQLLDEEFTMPELQSIYEAILGVSYDRRNFSKKVLSLGIAEPIENACEPTNDDCMAMPCLQMCSEPTPTKKHSPKSPRMFSFNKKKFDFIRKKKNDGTSMPFDF